MAEKVAFDKATRASDLEIQRDELAGILKHLDQEITSDQRKVLSARQKTLESNIARDTEDLAGG